MSLQREFNNAMPLLLNLRRLDFRTKLTLVNRFFNEHTHFLPDATKWNIDDYWQTPMQTLLDKTGDCEDFAIAKYFTLLELGISDDRLRICYVKLPQRANQAHMVLLVIDVNDQQLVLDNLTDAIQPLSDRRDLAPVFSFNSTNIWLGGKRVGNANELDKWHELTERMKA